MSKSKFSQLYRFIINWNNTIQFTEVTESWYPVQCT